MRAVGIANAIAIELVADLEVHARALEVLASGLSVMNLAESKRNPCHQVRCRTAKGNETAMRGVDRDEFVDRLDAIRLELHRARKLLRGRQRRAGVDLQRVGLQLARVDHHARIVLGWE